MRLLGICVVSFFMISSISTAAEDMDGFRGLPWGSSIESIRESDPKLVEGHMGTMPGVTALKRADEDMTFGGIKSEAITYMFYKNKFTSISIDFRGFDNYEKLLIYCKKMFGPPTGVAVLRLEQYASFDSPRTGAMLLYQLSLQTSNTGRLYLYSKENLR